MPGAIGSLEPADAARGERPIAVAVQVRHSAQRAERRSIGGLPGRMELFVAVAVAPEIQADVVVHAARSSAESALNVTMSPMRTSLVSAGASACRLPSASVGTYRASPSTCFGASTPVVNSRGSTAAA